MYVNQKASGHKNGKRAELCVQADHGEPPQVADFTDVLGFEEFRCGKGEFRAEVISQYQLRFK